MAKSRWWWVAALAALAVLGVGLFAWNFRARTYAYYDNGETRRGTSSSISRLIAGATSDPRTKLAQGWEQSPGYSARYFTMNLLGIDQLHDDWTQTAAGPGNVVRRGDGKGGVYIGLLFPDTESTSTKVFLSLDSGKAYRIDLARPWKGGPWLVVRISETAMGTSPSGPAPLQLQPMSQMFPEGVSGRWLLPDGTILVEGPLGRSRHYGRYYPQYDGVAQVIIKDYDPTLLEITDDKVFFLTDSNPGDGLYAFPSITDYDLKESLLMSSKLVFLPVTQGARLGLDLPGAARGATLEAIRLNGDSVEIKWKALPPSVGPFFEIRSDAARKRLVIEISDVPAGKTVPPLPFSISGQGLIRSVRAKMGTSRGAGEGLTVFVSLDPDKWASLTYTQTRPAEDGAPALVLTISDDMPPTDLTPKDSLRCFGTSSRP